MTKQNLDIWYKEYLNQYKKTKKYVKSRGGKLRMVNTDGKLKEVEPSSRHDFLTDFISVANDNPKLSGKQIAQKMAKAELYELSWKNAEKLAESHVKEFGGKVSANLIYRYQMGAVKGENIWDKIKQRREQHDKEKINTYNSNKLIGQEFFGSEVKD